MLSSELKIFASHTPAWQVCTPILNLRSMNSYVESTFADWHKEHRLDPSAARQVASLPWPHPIHLSGTSSFGMSGVNAHMLLEAVHEVCEGAGGEIGALQRRRHWVLAPVHHLVGHAVPSALHQKTWCSLAIDLSRAGLSYLHDHQVGGSMSSALGLFCCRFSACAEQI